MIPSIVDQVMGEWVDVSRVNPSPRNYNASTCSIHGKVWMAYRSHRLDNNGRCGVAICEMTVKNNQWLNLGGATGQEHHEDPRLFIFAGKLHVAYGETTFPKSRNYIAVQKYARLERVGGKWKVAEVFRPRYGLNHADLIEKNWQFFEHEGRLHAIYAAHPNHIVITLEGDKVVREHKSAGVQWPWGEIRGGTPPVRYGLGDQFITFFHSSTPVDTGWRRYWMGAYVFNAQEPFAVTHISPFPIGRGSEDDGHAKDPRWEGSWKPYVVFPGGSIPTVNGWDVCMGVNDWRIAIAHLKEPAMMPLGTERPTRYFRTANASRPIRLMQLDRSPIWVEWTPEAVSHIGAPRGYLCVHDAWMAQTISEIKHVDEITKEEYEVVFYKRKRMPKSVSA